MSIFSIPMSDSVSNKECSMRRVSRLTVKALAFACAVTLASSANAQDAAAQVEAAQVEATQTSVQALPQDASYDQQFAHARELATAPTHG
jgi:hypothetical protein